MNICFLTQVLLGWSKSCIVLAFRGTANAVNAWTDLKVATWN